jgi:hypothetical protein
VPGLLHQIGKPRVAGGGGEARAQAVAGEPFGVEAGIRRGLLD